MKKLFTLLMLLCTVCAGAWADNVNITGVDQLKDGLIVTIKSRAGSYYFNLDENNVRLTSSATHLRLVGDNTTGFKLLDNNNNRYVGKTRGNSTAPNTVTDESEAGLFTFAVKSGNYFVIHCENPAVSTNNNDAAYEYLQRKNNGTLVTWANSGNSNDFEIILTDLDQIQNRINTTYSNNGKVGYPDMTSIASYYPNGVNTGNISAAQSALNSLYENSDIKLPEAGKAYRIYNVTKNGTKRVVYYDGTTLKITSNGTTEVPAGKEGVFICGQDAQKFFFTNNSGKYFRVSSTDKVKAASESYGEMVNSNNVNALTISKMATINACTDEQRFGLLMIKGYADFSGANGEHYLMGSNSQNFVQGEAGLQMFTDAAQSIGFLFEEVPNPNTIKLTNPNKSNEIAKKTLLDKRYVGTFSAPYAVELRNGVEAYIASVTDDVVTFAKLENGNIVPRNTGVMLYAPEAEDNITEDAVPAISTVDMTGRSNAFVGSNAGSVVMQSGYYVLGKKEAGVGFYPAVVESTLARNKAYLDLSQHPQVSAFRFDFEGEGITTDISSVMGLNKQSEGVAFDLAGRRVNANVKGISIVGGKKVIR